jgi:hypothetical protein
MSANFRDLVRRHVQAERAEAEASEEVKTYRVRWWVLEVERLLEKIQTWLQPLIDDGSVNFRKFPLQRSEDWFGTYATNSAVITIGNEAMNLVPVGTGIIGSFGRIDVNGPRGNVMFVLHAKKNGPDEPFQLTNSAWNIVRKEQQRRTQTELTESSFGSLLTELFGIEG